MKFNRFIKFFLILLLFIFTVLPTFSNLVLSADLSSMISQRIENYTVQLDIQDKIFVTQSFFIKNEINKPVVPGFAKLMLFEGAVPTDIIVNIDGSVKRIDNFELIDGKPAIYYDIWQPISPGKRLEVKVSFTLDDVIKKGIIFENLDFQIGQFLIPINSAELIFKIPKSKYISYSSPNYFRFEKVKESRYYHYNIRPDTKVSIELSPIPLPTLPFHAYWLWSGFALIGLLYFAVQVKRMFSRINDDSKNILKENMKEN